MRGLIALVLVWTALTPVLAAQASITGRVIERRGDQVLRVVDCLTFAQSIENGGLAGVYSDGEGRFHLEFPPQERVFVATRCSGYRAVGANGRPGLRPTFDCSKDAPCGELELELERLGVVDGYVIGPQGQPVEGIEVVLRATSAPDPRRTRMWRGHSDDRGYYRIHSIPPGEYELRPQPRNQSRSRPTWEGEPITVRLAPGADSTGLQVPLQLKPRAVLRGRIAGLPPGTEQVQIEIASEQSSSNENVAVDENGVFEIEGVAEGAYRVALFESSGEGSERQLRRRYLGVAEAGPSPAATPLAILEPAVIEGRVSEVVWPRRGDLGPPQDSLRLQLEPAVRRNRLFGYETAVAKDPDYTFRMVAEQPGEYRLRVLGPGPVVEQVAEDGTRAPLPETFRLESGDRQELNLAVRFSVSRLTVLVTPAPGSDEAEQGLPAAHYVVALRDGDRLITYPTDQNGRLLLRYFLAGSWEIAAWRSIDPKTLRDDSVWEAAGDAVRRFTQTDETDLEITLTAVPAGEPEH